MIFTSPMRQLVAVVLDHDADKVTRELLRLGVMHFITVTDVVPRAGSGPAAVPLRVTEAQIAEIRRRIEGFLGLIDVTPESGVELSVEELSALNLEETAGELDRIGARLQEFRERQRRLQEEILRLEDIRRQLVMFGDLRLGLPARSQYSFLDIRTGAVKETAFSEFSAEMREIPSVQMSFPGGKAGENTVLLISMRRDQERVSRILSRYGWQEVELPRELRDADQELKAQLEGKLAGLRAEQHEVNTRLREAVQAEQERMVGTWRNLRLNELYARIQGFFSETARTRIFSGWVPADSRRELERSLRRATGNRCYLEWHAPAEVPEQQREEVPVRLANPRFLAPFQMLVQNYATPAYGTIDPTPFVAVAYLAMFALMFGDAGHGLVLLLSGLVGLLVYRGRSANVRNLFKLIVWCGGAAIVAGLLFGEVFGQRWLPALWFDYHAVVVGESHSRVVRDIYGILMITIYFGIAVIALGLLFNWVNLVARRRWFELIFDKGGLIGSWIYAIGIYVSFYFVRHDYRQLPGEAVLTWGVALPALLLALKAPMEFFRHREAGRRFTVMTPVDFFMEWVVELLEIFSGYLANTLSFMRVAGLGIAHVTLMVAFAQIAGMVAGGGGYTAGSYLVLVLGNLLVIVLEGLSAGVQSLRLNYYEFFSKYFSGSGRAYAPVTLRRAA